MEYTRLEGIDKEVSRLVYGTPGASMDGDKEAACIAYEKAYSYGFRMFDNANSYGFAEECMGYWLKKTGHREDIVIMDKGCNPGQKGSEDIFSAETIRSQVDLSLQRLGTDYIDLYVLHRDDPTKPVDEIVEILNELKKDGKIRKFGGSNWTMERLLETQEYAKKHNLEGFSVCSPAYSLAELKNDPWGGSVTISGPANEAFRLWLEKTRLPVIPYSSQGRGFMSGKFKTYDNRPIEEVLWWAPIEEYDAPDNRGRLARAEKMAEEKGSSVSAIVLAWLLAQPMFILPIICSTGDVHLKEATDAFSLSLTEAECRYLLCGE